MTDFVPPPTGGYDAALDWLFARSRGGAPRDPGRMTRLIDLLALAQPPATVHVVGTNGKGTVAAMIAAGLAAAGRRCGLFVSPHVEDFRERISVSGTPIGRSEVVDAVARIGRDAALTDFGFFELTLALALGHFSAAGAEVAVIEAGIGARNDATSAVGNRVLTVLTNVALDHQALLGDSLAQIADDKLAAVRPGVPLVSGAVGDAALAARRTARERGAPCHLESDGGALFALPGDLEPSDDEATLQNRRLAAAALRLLDAPEAAVVAGLRTAVLPGRRERFSLRGRQVVLDGAHDPEAARLLARAQRTPYLLVFGALKRKQGQASFEQLSRAALGAILTEAAAGEGPPEWAGEVPFVADPVAALERALAECPERANVVVGGSLYLAGRLRPYLRRHHGT